MHFPLQKAEGRTGLNRAEETERRVANHLENHQPITKEGSRSRGPLALIGHRAVCLLEIPPEPAGLLLSGKSQF